MLSPVSDLVGAIVGAAVSGLIEQNMGGTTTPGIAQRVNDGLKAALLGSLTTSLIRPLTATAAAVRLGVIGARWGFIFYFFLHVRPSSSWSCMRCAFDLFFFSVVASGCVRLRISVNSQLRFAPRQRNGWTSSFGSTSGSVAAASLQNVLVPCRSIITTVWSALLTASPSTQR